MQNERILDLFPGADNQTRLVLAVVENSQGSRRYTLRQETFSGNVGWFVQSRIAIEPGQLAGLKAALTCGRTDNLEPRPSRDRASTLTLRVAAAS